MIDARTLLELFTYYEGYYIMGTSAADSKKDDRVSAVPKENRVRPVDDPKRLAECLAIRAGRGRERQKAPTISKPSEDTEA